MPSKKDLPDLDSLGGRISKTKRAIEHGEQPREETVGKQAMRIGADLVAGVAVGMTLGWYLDDYLNTKPLFMFLGLAVGFAAGMRLMLTGMKQREEIEKDIKD